jgi:DNA-binding CsgD family transcriptional regulator
VPYLSPTQRINALRNASACHGRSLNVVTAVGLLNQAAELAALEGEAEEATLIGIDLSALALDDASRYGVGDDVRVRALVSGTRGELFLERGDVRSAIEWLERAKRLAEAASDQDLVLWCLGVQLQAHVEAGDISAASVVAARARELQGVCSPMWKYTCMLAEVRLWSELQEPAIALRLCESVVEELVDLPLALDGARAYLMLAWLRHLSGALPGALEALNAVVDAVERIGSKDFLRRHLRTMPSLLSELAPAGFVSLRAAVGPMAGWNQNGKGKPNLSLPGDPDVSHLSARELDLVVGLCEGLNRIELCERLGLSKSTVDKLVSQVYAATGFGACHQIVAWAFRSGLYDSERGAWGLVGDLDRPDSERAAS